VTFSVVIPTHNRKEDLRRTCEALEALRPPPKEIIVCADGCTDGTAEFLRTRHPGIRLLVNEQSRGSIAARDAMIRGAKGDIVVSLDDDSHPAENDFFETLEQIFKNNLRLAVATFPQRSDEFPESLKTSRFGPPMFAGSYTSSGAAIRRNVFIALGGYPRHFRHAYEEPDFALRAWNAGFEVRYETVLTIRHHYTQAQRNENRTHCFHARNELWSVVMRCPFPQLFAVAAFRAVRQFQYAWMRGWVLREPLWWGSFLAGLPRCIAARHPIPWNKYRTWMELVRNPRAGL